ncbi:hypothetical protein TNCV_4564881 [Trichonephila clavipes]|nr:hypothetical protein TNCV_4564881 [Trichonephila clavipes]
MALSDSLPQINLGVQGRTQGGPHNDDERHLIWHITLLGSTPHQREESTQIQRASAPPHSGIRIRTHDLTTPTTSS